jgi:hypothetical protein
LQSVGADGNSVVRGASNEGVGLRFVEPDFPRNLPVTFGKLPIWASPQGAESCFDNGADALHETRVVRMPYHTILAGAIFCSKVVDFPTKVIHPLGSGEDGCPRRLTLLRSTGLRPEQGQVTDVEAVHKHDFTGTALNVEVDTRTSLGSNIWKGIERPQKRLRMGGPVGDITGSLG